MHRSSWSSLPESEWTESLAFLHRCTQIMGKARLVNDAWLNHSWAVALYVTPSGLRTGLVPHDDGGGFEMMLDVRAGRLSIDTTDAETWALHIADRSVAEVFDRTSEALDRLGLTCELNPVPSEIPDASPLDQERDLVGYDIGHAQALLSAWHDAKRVMDRFRAGFTGKVSPVHLFWGSFDLAVTRFSGREAPPHEGGVPRLPDDVAREAYSHEVSSCGFWPGNRDAPEPIFYAYAYPTPPGYRDATVEPPGAGWLEELGEFALPHRDIAAAPDPDAHLMAFLQSTYAAAAELAGWDRGALEVEAPDGGPDWWRRRASET